MRPTLLIALSVCAMLAHAGESAAANAAGGPWKIPVLVVRYFPLTADGKNIDAAVTSNVGGTLENMRKKCERMTAEAVQALTEGSRFRAYNNKEAKPSLNYEILETLEYLESMPRNEKKAFASCTFGHDGTTEVVTTNIVHFWTRENVGRVVNSPVDLTNRPTMCTFFQHLSAAKESSPCALPY